MFFLVFLKYQRLTLKIVQHIYQMPEETKLKMTPNDDLIVFICNYVQFNLLKLFFFAQFQTVTLTTTFSKHDYYLQSLIIQ